MNWPAASSHLAALCAVALLVTPAHAQLGADARKEPPYIPLDQVFSESLMQSGSHRVEDNLRVKGTLFEFTIDSEHGRYDALSIPMAIVRIHEILTLAQATDAFQRENQQLAERLRGVVYVGRNSTVDILSSPLASAPEASGYVSNNVSQTIEGLGRQTRSSNPQAGKPGQGPGAGGNVYEALLPGDPILASYKRSVAAQLDLDVYSSNSRVQDFLNTLARARAGGNRNAGMVTVSLPNRPEISVDRGRIELAVRSAMARKTVRELYMQNETALAAIGVEPDLYHAFLSHRAYSPRHKTEIVAYLDYMEGVANRGEFLRAALRATDEVSALGYARMARMLAYYHETTERLKGLVSGGRVLMATTSADNMTLVLPFDLLWWSAEADRVFSSLAKFADENDFKVRELLVVGVVSEVARVQLEGRKFRVRERFLLRP